MALLKPGSPITLISFDFIDGLWQTRLICKSLAGTAVDQWGWDFKEMWELFTHDKDLMNLIAECWVRPMAASYLPHQYREDIAGWLLIALSKYPKPGVCPIRRILGRGLLQHAFHLLFSKRQPKSNTAAVLQMGRHTCTTFCRQSTPMQKRYRHAQRYHLHSAATILLSLCPWTVKTLSTPSTVNNWFDFFRWAVRHTLQTSVPAINVLQIPPSTIQTLCGRILQHTMAATAA
jgi:hypothetical protein